MMENRTETIFTLYSDVQAVPVTWLWYPYIAIGKITLLQGDPGDGKSTMMLNLISAISKGGVTPDGAHFGKPKRVIYQCSEDDAADTIKPRLEECGADCNQVAFINEDAHNALTLDDERLRQAIIEFRPSLLVIDPIQAYLGNDSDLQIAGRVRKLMQRLSLWATAYDCAVVLIGHLNKKEGGKVLYRSLGSIDLTATARSVLQVERSLEDADIRIVRQIKNNLASTGADIQFEIRPETGFQWLNSRQGKDAPAYSDIPAFETKAEKATYLIKEMLKTGDKKANEVYESLSAAGISHRTAEQTKKEIGVQCYRKKRQWYWSLGKGVASDDR
ncbi:AAA family ATPase [Lacrimispora indolis]|jgi:hypothetical protein|uniref:AAA family ATPase n=1 Tax=Lacrimispora indolis TaxID=69825 RepID=UPI0004628204|nr:AAA family ATPase [[Clostridium] methoxybenzovorans]